MFKRIDASSIHRSLAQGAHWRLALTALLVALLLATGVNAPASAQTALPTVAPKGPGSPAWVTPPDPWLYSGSGYAGSIYIGAVPPGSEYKPVLVFVPGKGCPAQDWWGN